MDELGDGSRGRPGTTAPLTVRATRSGGARLRAAGVIAAGLVVVGAGVYGRLEASKPAPVAALVPATVVSSPEPPDTTHIETHGYVPPLLEFLPHVPARTTEPGGDGLMGGPRTSETHLIAVIMLDRDQRLFSRLYRDADGIYQATIPLVVPRQTMTATLELSVQESGRTRGDVERPADRVIARLPIQLDARPFPPGSLAALAETIAGRPNSLPAGSITVPGFTVLATLFSNGHAVELSIVVAPLRPLWNARRIDPCRQSIYPYPRNAPDRSTNC